MKKSGLSINPDIHHSKVFSSDQSLKGTAVNWMSLYIFNYHFIGSLTVFSDIFLKTFDP